MSKMTVNQQKTGYVMTSDYDFRYKTIEIGGIALQTSSP